jgi:hypothetical protein
MFYQADFLETDTEDVHTSRKHDVYHIYVCILLRDTATLY